MNRTEKISKQGNNQQIFTPISLVEPNLYYNPLMNENLLLNEQSSNNTKNNKNLNLSQPKNSKKNKKNKNSIEISLISLLNAISDLSTKELNTNTNSKKDISIKNDSFSSDSEKQGDSYAVMELLTQKTKEIKNIATHVHLITHHIMQKVCAPIVIILEEGKKNHGIAHMEINFIMHLVCAKIAIR